MLGQLFAGTGLGLLVGVLVGLSASPVVSALIGALAAGMVTLLGFTRTTKEGDPPYAEGSVIRLGSFGVACAVAVLLGLYIRTHNWLSPSISDQVAEIQKAGYTAEEARKWVALRNIGTALAPTAASTADGKSATAAAAPIAGSVLFSGANEGQCQYFDTSRYKDTQEHLYALRQMGGIYAEYANKIASMDATQQKAVLNSLRLLFCPL